MTKSFARRADAARRSPLATTRALWAKGYETMRGRPPRWAAGRKGRRLTKGDEAALRAIVHRECQGDERLIAVTIAEMLVRFRTCIGGLMEHYLLLCWWYACGQPHRHRPLPPNERRELLANIRLNAAMARGGA